MPMPVVKKGDIVGYTNDLYATKRPAIVTRLREDVQTPGSLYGHNQHVDLVVFDETGAHFVEDVKFGDDTSYQQAWISNNSLNSGGQNI